MMDHFIRQHDETIDQLKTEIAQLKSVIKDLNTNAQRAASAFLKNMTESLPQYVFWKDVNSVYLGCNKNYAEFVGLKSIEDIIGKTDADLKWQSTGDTADTFQKGDQITMSGNPITNQEERLVLPNGKTMITLVSKLPIINNGKVIGLVGYFTDITELKQKEKELIKAKQDAEAANQAKSTFITNISHDIRTPLSGMIGMARIILKDVQSKKSEEAATNLFRAGNMLLDLLNEILEVTKLESGNLPICEVKFSLKELINKITILIKPSIMEKRLNLSVHYDETIPNYLIGDQTRIHRILLNLVSNAIKFTHKGNIDILINLAEKKGRDLILKIAVKDTGMGMSPESKQIIFSRFTRLDPAYKGTYRGFGLGLSIVKQFISELDGEIYVESEKNKGSIFTCIVPLKGSLLDEPGNKINLETNLNPDYKKTFSDLNYIAVATHVSLQPSNTPTLPKLQLRVLLVEDDKIAQFATRNLLEEIGCHIDIAGTGSEAIQLFKTNRYHLVLMDIGLPDKNGYEITAELHALEKIAGGNTPIVALTAHLDETNKKECFAVGMQKALVKPLTYELANTILAEFVNQSGDLCVDDCTSQGLLS